MSAPVVLFVDDEEGLLDLYRHAFTREGFTAEVAATLNEARQRIAAGGIDVVVLDIRMTEGSGLTLLREIKSSDSRLPVVLSTAFARYQDDFASWLADAYVVKSSDLGELKLAIRRCLERSQ